MYGGVDRCTGAHRCAQGCSVQVWVYRCCFAKVRPDENKLKNQNMLQGADKHVQKRTVLMKPPDVKKQGLKETLSLTLQEEEETLQGCVGIDGQG